MEVTYVHSPGGKGANQAVAAAKLGAKVYMTGCVGKDNFGEALLANLENNKVDIKYVDCASEPTGNALITVDSKGANTIVVISGANKTCNRGHVDRVLAEIDQPGILLVQHELTEDTVEYAIKSAKDKGWTIILNLAPARSVPHDVLSMVDILIPNETEASYLIGKSLENYSDYEYIAKEFINLGVQSVIITMGSNGVVCSNKLQTVHISAIKVDAVDTTAAGMLLLVLWLLHYQKDRQC